MLDHAEYQAWQAFAARCSRRRADAQDLLHDALLIAIHRGRADLSDKTNRSWLKGVIRNQAKMVARTAARRQARERTAFRPQPLAGPDDASPSGWLRQLPKGARIVATLALHGMTRDEIRCCLRLSDAALRQRLVTIRKSLQKRPWLVPDLPPQPSGLDFGLLRLALLPAVRRRKILGTHDLDGHLLAFEGHFDHTKPTVGNTAGA